MTLPPAVKRQSDSIVVLERQVRDLRRQMNQIATGGRVRGGSVVGPIAAAASQPDGAVTLWINGSGATREAGDVVVFSAVADRTALTTTTAGNARSLGVVVNETDVPAADAGMLVRHSGYIPAVKVAGAVVVGEYLETSTTAARARSAGTHQQPGSFAVALTAFAGPGNGEVAAYIIPVEGPDEIGISIVIDGGGAAITTGIKLDLEVPFDMVVEGWTMLADQAGSIVVDVWADTYAAYPPVVGDSITGTEKPTITADDQGQDLALTTWVAALTKGQTLRVNVDSCATITRCTLALRGRRA